MNETKAVQKQIVWQIAEDQAEKVFALARKEGWSDVVEFCRGGMISRPIEQQGWILKPIEQYEGIIPPEAKMRSYQIIKSGVKVAGWVVGEDKRILERESTLTEPVLVLVKRPNYEVQNRLKAIGSFVTGLAVSAVVVALVMAAVVVAIGALIVALIAAAAAATVAVPIVAVGAAGAIAVYDPVLICVVQNGDGEFVWVQVYQWWD